MSAESTRLTRAELADRLRLSYNTVEFCELIDQVLAAPISAQPAEKPESG